MWVRTTLRIERWTKEKPEDQTDGWDESESQDINRLPNWERGHLLTGVASNTDTSTFSEDDFKEAGRCCWKHKQCAGHVIHPFISDYGHRSLHLHAVSHCDCDCRVKECSEKTKSSSSREVDQSCSRDIAPTCFKIIQTPCFELIPEEECVEHFWYGWCKNYSPVSVAVIHHPIHHTCAEDDPNEDDEEERKPPIPSQVGPTAQPPDTSTGTVTGTANGTANGTPDSAAPITIWRSESPTGKTQGNKVIKKVKKKKEKEKEESSSDKDKLKKKIKKSKVTKKKSPVTPEPLPPESGRTLSPRELARMSESSPDSREDLDSEESYNDPSSEDMVEPASPRKKEKGTNHKKPNGKVSKVKKVNRRKSPPTSNPNLS
ncbi:protein PROCA1 [Rhynchocyon petersi]